MVQLSSTLPPPGASLCIANLSFCYGSMGEEGVTSLGHGWAKVEDPSQSVLVELGGWLMVNDGWGRNVCLSGP